MALAKRILLFCGLNFLIIITLFLVISLLNLEPYLNAQGIDLKVLLIFSLIWGMGGALISLAMSRMAAVWFMGVKVIEPHTNNPHEQYLLQMVYRLAKSAGISTMPTVGIYESDELNAFATGPTKSRSLIAVSSGLLQRMNDAEIEGVLGHEVAHIANGDMVTMALLQGVVNAFVIFLSRVLAYAVAVALGEKRDQGFSYGIYFLVSFVLQIIFLILGSLLVAWYSRRREYRADEGGARFAGRNKMIAALSALLRGYELNDEREQPAINNLKISGKGLGIFALFSTHPPLQERIKRLSEMA